MKVYAIEKCIDSTAFIVIDIYRSKKKAEKNMEIMEEAKRKENKYANLHIEEYELK